MTEANTHTIKLNTKIYPMSAIYSAAYVFLDRAYLELSGDPDAEITLTLTPKEGEDAHLLDKEFKNELINYLNYSQHLGENQEVVKLIIEKALFSANPNLSAEAEEQEIQDLIKEFDKQDQDDAKHLLESSSKTKP